MEILRMLPVIVLLSILLALTVCLLAWILAGRPTQARARHGVVSRRVDADHRVRVVDEPPPPPLYKGPDDDPEFIRQLARSIAERGRSQDGDPPPDLTSSA